MKKIKHILIWLLVIFMVPTMVMADTPMPGDPVQPNSNYFLYGNVKIDGSDAPENTLVAVYKGDTELKSVSISEAGKYILENVTGINEEDTLTYKVSQVYTSSEGFTAPENTVFRADLCFESNTPEPEPEPSPSSSGGGGGGGGYVDNTPPTETAVIINNDDDSTAFLTVNLGLSAEGANTMMISNDSEFTDGFWENYTTNREWILSEGTGAKNVYVKYRDGAHNVADVVTDSIELTGQVLGVKINGRQAQIDQLEYEATYTWPGDASRQANEMGLGRDQDDETAGYDKYVLMLLDGVDGMDQYAINAITNFIVYGTPSTKLLGAGERAGVLNSYKSAFGKLPDSYEEWLDLLKIANGRWPEEKSEIAESKAKESFKLVYLRDANMDNSNDNAAVTIMAYGLRSDSRNMDNEKVAIDSFEYIFGHSPSSATDWDIVRAIAYSGAVR